MTLRAAVFLLCLLAPAGLGAAGCASFVSHAERDAYRAVRASEDERDRLLLMRAYLSAHPEGAWSREFRAAQRAADERVWSAGRSTRDGLAYYLEVFPDGLHAADARVRLRAFDAVGERRVAEAAAREAVLGARDDTRRDDRQTWLARALEYWLRTLAAVDRWGAPIGEVALANAQFDRAYGGAPKPVCTRNHCIKRYAADFGIRVPGGTGVRRRLELVLRLVLREGGLVRAELLLPGRGFSRWFEHFERTLVADEDPAQRTQAIGWALDRVAPILDAVLAGGEREDVIPDPIAPITAGPAQTAQHAPTGTGQGAGETQDAGAEPQSTPHEAAPTTLVIPATLYARRGGALRAVVFAAADDDRGDAADGVYLEWIPPTGAPRTPPGASRAPKSRPEPQPGR